MTRAVEPILRSIRAARQKDARHYGVHPYFTRRPANVVRAYIERYSKEGDTVLDPFGGTGVTAIESFLLGRRAIQNDLNPFANFIAESVADTTLRTTMAVRQAFSRVEESCAVTIRRIDHDVEMAQRLLMELPLPENIRLPRTSDAPYFYDMFTPRQLAGLALLKQAIERETEGVTKKLLLLAWSASIAKLNKTFLSAKGRAASRGGSSIFSIYRYKLAKQHIELPIWETFRGRFANVLAAKEEVLRLRNYYEGQSQRPLEYREAFSVLCHDASTLDRVIEPETIDYVFTDPPYGAFINYLDLSILWNHWLGFAVAKEARERETVVGGEEDLSESHYKESLRRSIEVTMKLLRPDRWLSIVFQHWDISYFATILEAVTGCGGELRAAITQTGDVIWSMHKKKNSASVLAGEMILTFYKPKGACTGERLSKAVPQCSGETVLSDVFDACLENGKQTFASEELFNRLILELWRQRALGCLSLSRQEFARELESRGWIYNTRSHRWTKRGSMERLQPTLFSS